ncbi:hypothetical protein GALMADRAFT_222027 [Galerina marginata CBS 339.88]|uniref:Piwi domain-containing protein n=1 Tax=Galerina marginata (strain CBS 339.88) TaxID=685588 RepID=A0A067TIG9_GALM3|nr:hypothetical protein GALMADRAFT_222027 [Galerina marginata CBS 339.88]
MPPRGAPGRAGHPRGGANPPQGGRGGGAVRGSQPSGLPAAHVNAVGLKRPNFGTAGRRIQVQVNSFAITAIPQGRIFHYDGRSSSLYKLPARFNMELFKILQSEETEVFTPKIVYDGRKIAFAPRELPLGESRRFPVTLPQANGGGNPTRQPRIYYITLKKVAEIDVELLERYIMGQQSTEEKILMAITALNVVLRMEPNLNYPFNRRSFYTPQETRNIGGGLTLWRGIFQSIRPTIGRLVVNVDLATGVMYKEGRLLDLCIEFFNRPQGTNPRFLSPVHNFSERDRHRLARFLTGLRVLVSTTGNKTRTIRGLSSVGADTYEFATHAGNTTTVAQYFQSLGRPLQCPTVGSTAMIPLEMCTVPRGQIMRKQVPDDKVKDVLEFSTLRPDARLDSIRRGIQNLQYGQSDYVRQFGMAIDTEPLKVDVRVLNPPKLKYGSQSRQPTVVSPSIDKKFFEPAAIARWAMVVYESPNRFPDAACRDAVNGFLAACASVGVQVATREPLIKYQHGQGSVEAHLKAVGAECNARLGGFPSLLVVILPDGGNDIYTAVKQYVGIPTQCLKSNKCGRAKPQYWANVLLKVNPKMGGINVIPDASVAVLSDPLNPTIIMGADVIHPAPGATDRPSFTAVVGSVDSHSAKYVTTSRAQTGRQEIINDLKDMCKDILGLYKGYRQNVEKQKQLNPKRLIFYRDGVSEGQFKHVLELVFLMLNPEACKEMGMNPQITLVIVGKRHHNQLFPPGNIADRSGNSPAGSVIDTGIAHPTDFDFILQSHAGLLGTSQPGHYTVLADSIQALSFALCHVYARSTRSVSIPAPVYYADIVCARAKNHFDPQGNLDLTDTSTQASASGAGPGGLEAYKLGYKPLHQNQRTKMYFMLDIVYYYASSVVMPKFSPEPKFEPELLEPNAKFSSKFSKGTEPNVKSSSRFRLGGGVRT